MNNEDLTPSFYCHIKTHKSLYHETEKAIKAIHPYETPEIIAIVEEQTKRAVLVIFAPVHYDSQLLRSRAHFFAKRVIHICGDHLVGIQILGNRKG